MFLPICVLDQHADIIFGPEAVVTRRLLPALATRLAQTAAGPPRSR